MLYTPLCNRLITSLSQKFRVSRIFFEANRLSELLILLPPRVRSYKSRDIIYPLDPIDKIHIGFSKLLVSSKSHSLLCMNGVSRIRYVDVCVFKQKVKLLTRRHSSLVNVSNFTYMFIFKIRKESL